MSNMIMLLSQYSVSNVIGPSGFGAAITLELCERINEEPNLGCTSGQTHGLAYDLNSDGSSSAAEVAYVNHQNNIMPNIGETAFVFYSLD